MITAICDHQDHAIYRKTGHFCSHFNFCESKRNNFQRDPLSVSAQAFLKALMQLSNIPLKPFANTI
jgi:hypothetical protein